MRKLIFILVFILLPSFALGERIFGCDFDADETEDFVEAKRCAFNDNLQRIVCEALVVKLSSDNKRQFIDFRKNKSRARRGYSNFTCTPRPNSTATDLFGTNRKNSVNKIKKIRDEPLANDFVGTWLIQKEDTTSYWIFRDNGTFIKKRAGQPLNGVTHFVGTYTVADGLISGDFINPGVGRGEIEGRVTKRDRFLMDFIEYWHTPRKVVACVGIRQ